jgi:hypothetical protein
LQLKLEARGNLRSVQTLTATGQLALAHFAVRGQAVDQLTASLTYSNLTAELLRPHLVRAGGAQEFNADKLTLDIAGQKLFFVNGLAHVEPLAVARAIGPKTAAGMEPFQFLAVPTVHVSGCVPLRQENDEIVTDDADMWFEMEGTVPFRWLKFETPTIHGTIRWWKDYLILTNATTECYGGTAQGYGSFYLETPGDGTDFNAFMTATNVDFHRMGQALWSPTNQLEGSLSGTLLISKANSADWRTWNGSGDAKLHDGLLWDVPVFAFMSQILNGITPGLGNSRATEAAGKFILTNGVVFTDSLVIQAQSMRLEYNGTVDLDCNVNARVTARIFRNMPLIGPLVSVLFTPLSKVTECHVAGTLGEPKITPVYIPGFIPKVLSVPLHPLRTVEDIFSSPATNSASTNTPSAGK